MWTYATCGMSSPSDALSLELHLFSPTETLRHVEILSAIVHFHRTGEKLGLGGNSKGSGVFDDASSIQRLPTPLNFLDPFEFPSPTPSTSARHNRFVVTLARQRPRPPGERQAAQTLAALATPVTVAVDVAIAAVVLPFAVILLATGNFPRC